VRFTIGTSRPYDTGRVPTQSFPNISGLEHRPKIIFEPSATFEQTERDSITLDVKLPKPTIKLAIEEATQIPVVFSAPVIALKISKVEIFSIASDNFVVNLNIAFKVKEQSINIGFTLPKPVIAFKIAKEIEMTIAGGIYEPAIALNIKEVPEIVIIATLPDLGTPAEVTPPISIPVVMPLPIASMVIFCSTGEALNIVGGLPKPAIALSIFSEYDSNSNSNSNISILCECPVPVISLTMEQLGFNIFVKLKAPTFNFSIEPLPIFNLQPIEIKSPVFNFVIEPKPTLSLQSIEIKPPAISLLFEQLGFDIHVGFYPPSFNIIIDTPAFDFSEWFNSLLTHYNSDGVFLGGETSHINPVIVSPNITLEITQNPSLSINPKLPKLQTSLSMKRDDNSPNRLNIPITLPALEIDLNNRVISLNPIMIKPPTINIQTLTSSDFL
jgi:hypothetical protein